jgi:hypothetical protein
MVHFSPLNQAVLYNCTIDLLSIFTQYIYAGFLCSYGLSKEQPIRGSIDIGWGVEMYPNELYGRALASAYDLESKVADYPRIVIGDHLYKFLVASYNSLSRFQPSNSHDQYLKIIALHYASRCLEFTGRDDSDTYFLHYLGDTFLHETYLSNEVSNKTFSSAYIYILSQIQLHTANKDPKLLQRYQMLKLYFDNYPIRAF